MNAITVNGLTLRLGARTILSSIDVAIGNGEFIGVLGSNGAGKTTLMRALLGLVRPVHGSITVLGQPVTRGNPLIGYMPQARVPVARRLSGFDVVAAAADGHRWGLPLLNTAARRDVEAALALVDAGALASRAVGEMSGGERQRLLLAQSLLGRPRILLLDEPLISLDPHRQHELVALVTRLQRTLGLTVLFSAHDINPLAGVLDRVLYLAGGNASVGPVDEVITTESLSRLYGAPIEVIRMGTRIFVSAADSERNVTCLPASDCCDASHPPVAPGAVMHGHARR